MISWMVLSVACRSPHGERGLKFVSFVFMACRRLVALLMESVD